jgi:hypothetical protein
VNGVFFFTNQSHTHGDVSQTVKRVEIIKECEKIAAERAGSNAEIFQEVHKRLVCSRLLVGFGIEYY